MPELAHRLQHASKVCVQVSERIVRLDISQLPAFSQGSLTHQLPCHSAVNSFAQTMTRAESALAVLKYSTMTNPPTLKSTGMAVTCFEKRIKA